jgi:hypothetical protein
MPLSPDLQERVKQFTVELRQPYIDYIGEIAKTFPSDWWRSSVSEKNPYVSNTFFYTCCLKACLDYLSSAGANPEHLTIDEPVLRRVLNRNLKAAGHDIRVSERRFGLWWSAVRGVLRIPLFQIYFLRNAIKVLFARYRYRLHRSRPLKALGRTPVSLTHIWIDLRAYSSETGEFKDLDFADVSRYLRSRGNTVAGFAEILLGGRSYRKIVRYIANSGVPVLVPHSFLRLRDVIACLWHSLVHFPKRRTYPPFCGLDISDLIFNDLRQEWFTQREAENFLYKRRIERMKDSGIIIERFIYTFENHTWERITCDALREAYPSIKLIAYQPNGLPLLLLNYFISESESHRIPLPDRIVANGSYTARVLADGGFGHQRVVLGGALRQSYLQPLLYGGRLPEKPPKTQSPILVTPSISYARTIELIQKILEAFGRSTDLSVIIKCHPSIQFQQLKRYVVSGDLPSNIHISTEPLMKLLPGAGLLIYNDGTFAAAEALAFGIPVMFVEPEYGLSLDSLDGFPHVRRSARTAEDIARAARDLLHSPQHRTDSLDVVRQLAGEVTEKTFDLFA